MASNISSSFVQRNLSKWKRELERRRESERELMISKIGENLDSWLHLHQRTLSLVRYSCNLGVKWNDCLLCWLVSMKHLRTWRRRQMSGNTIRELLLLIYSYYRSIHFFPSSSYNPLPCSSAFQPPMSAPTGFSIGAQQPRCLNYWSLTSLLPYPTHQRSKHDEDWAGCRNWE